jgi:fructose-1,6-bisphosphatase/inositol monophosphatase family enzyme
VKINDMNELFNWRDLFFTMYQELNINVKKLYSEGKGKNIIGDVAGRDPKEDRFLEIDKLCEDHIMKYIKTSPYSIEVFSEHGHFVINPKQKINYIMSVDPFDGTSLFKTDIPAEWWSVLTIYNPISLQPVCAAAIDFIREEFYYSEGDSFSYCNISTKKFKDVSVIPKTNLEDGIVLATYCMSPNYSLLWYENTSRLLKSLNELENPPRIWPNGGSCIYPWLARGLIDAYLMFDEPNNEVNPGLGFITPKNFCVYEITNEKKLLEYSFVPALSDNKIKSFIASTNHKLAEAIINLL